MLFVFVALVFTVFLVQRATKLILNAAPTSTVEAESASVVGISIGSDNAASGGKFIQFGTVTASITPTITPAPTNLPSDPNFQPSAPYYTTFFYPWYENPNTDGRWSQWTDLGHTPPQNWFSEYLPDPNPNSFDPANELYSSSNDAIINWQLRKMAEAKIEVAVSSWWGQTHKTNKAFSKIIKDVMNRTDNPYPNLRWAIYYECEGVPDGSCGGTANPSVSKIVADLNYIRDNYANQPGYLKIGGKPVVFVYNAAHSGSNSLEDLARWKEVRAQTGFYVNMKVDPLNSGANPLDMDSWHEYAPAVRTTSRNPYWFMVSPGFWLNNSSERLPRNAIEFENGIRSMVASTATWKIVETWNEWGEGSGVEPAEQVNQTTNGVASVKINGYPFKNLYIDILNRNLPALERGVGSGGNPTTAPTASTSPTSTPVSGNTSPVVVASGDIVCGTGSSGAACKQMETANLASKLNPAAVLVLGDIQYEQGTLSDFQNYYHPSWGILKDKTYPSVGNHEYLTSGASGYFDYFNGVGNQTGRAGDRSKGYYAFNIGNWRLYSLNSNCGQAGGCGAGSPQEQWLRADLLANPRSCVLAYYHHPLHSSGSRTSTSVAPLFKALYDNNAELVLAGHEHNYERFAPQDVNANLDPARGIREFVVGTGGRNFTGFVTTAANSEVRNDRTFGVLKLTLNPTSYDFEFVPISGSTFTDKGVNIACH